MSKDFVKISKEELISFSRLIYSKALCGYADLEDPVCISESNKLFSSLKDSVDMNGSYSDLTITTDQVGWTFSSSPTLPESTCFINCNPYYNCTVSSQDSSNIGFSSPLIAPTERQLLLFDSLDSNTISNDPNEVFERDSDGESFFQDFDSNEGHIFF